jgi:hypothetical protein
LRANDGSDFVGFSLLTVLCGSNESSGLDEQQTVPQSQDGICDRARTVDYIWGVEQKAMPAKGPFAETCKE